MVLINKIQLIKYKNCFNEVLKFRCNKNEVKKCRGISFCDYYEVSKLI